jgi:hypothetical protein
MRLARLKLAGFGSIGFRVAFGDWGHYRPGCHERACYSHGGIGHGGGGLVRSGFGFVYRLRRYDWHAGMHDQ